MCIQIECSLKNKRLHVFLSKYVDAFVQEWMHKQQHNANNEHEGLRSLLKKLYGFHIEYPP